MGCVETAGKRKHVKQKCKNGLNKRMKQRRDRRKNLGYGIDFSFLSPLGDIMFVVKYILEIEKYFRLVVLHCFPTDLVPN